MPPVRLPGPAGALVIDPGPETAQLSVHRTPIPLAAAVSEKPARDSVARRPRTTAGWLGGSPEQSRSAARAATARGGTTVPHAVMTTSAALTAEVPMMPALKATRAIRMLPSRVFRSPCVRPRGNTRRSAGARKTPDRPARLRSLGTFRQERHELGVGADTDAAGRRGLAVRLTARQAPAAVNCCSRSTASRYSCTRP